MNNLTLEIQQLIKLALKEDIGEQDISALLIPKTTKATAQIITRETMILCGLDWVNYVFKNLDSTLEINWFFKDGDIISAETILCEILGNARAILTAERTALNFLQTLSGTATTTFQYAKRLKNLTLLDTRKTIPNLRLAQKYATKIGGAKNHRIGLYDAFLIKENHILACGSIKNAVEFARTLNIGKMIEVEVENLAELQEALSAKCERILLDNFTITMIKQAVKITNGKSKLEISGNITLENIHQYDDTGADFISIGALTKHIRAIDLSLRLQIS